MIARMAALVLTAVLLRAASGCAGEPTSPHPSASAPPASSEAERPMTDALAQRLHTAVNQPMTAARVPGPLTGSCAPRGTHAPAPAPARETIRPPLPPPLPTPTRPAPTPA